jgi:hypothetical protein
MDWESGISRQHLSRGWAGWLDKQFLKSCHSEKRGAEEFASADSEFGLSVCHPERNKFGRIATKLMESKDPCVLL